MQAENKDELAGMRRIATSAMIEFIRNSCGMRETEGCYFKAEDLPEVMALSALDPPRRERG